MHFLRLSIAAALSLSSVVLGEVYTLTDNFVGDNFLTGFDHQAIEDPTHGRGCVWLAYVVLYYSRHE